MGSMFEPHSWYKTIHSVGLNDFDPYSPVAEEPEQFLSDDSWRITNFRGE
jgi:hypothetical protein